MDILSSLVLTFLISLAICVITYLLQYCSVIGPCNIEFDCRQGYEMYLMNKYNIVTNKVFNIAMAVVFLSLISMLMSESIHYMLFMVVLEFVYFVINTILMLVFFVRSKIYWYKEDNKEVLTNKQ